MGPIGVKEAAAIGAEILDDLQCGHRTLRYDLLGALDGGGDGVGAEVHRNALSHQQQGAQQRSRQQDPEQGTREINPKVAERIGDLPGKTADKRNAHGQPRSARQKVLRTQSHHLAEIAHRVLARVGLPSGG